MLHLLRQDYIRNFMGGFALAAMAMLAVQPGLL
jgi:hypothetical protein